MNFFRKNSFLIAGIVLPIIFVIVLALAIYVPVSRIRPAYNFLYTNNADMTRMLPGGRQQYKYGYQVQDGHLVLVPLPDPDPVSPDGALDDGVTGLPDVSSTSTASSSAPVDEKAVNQAEVAPVYEYDVQDNTMHVISYDDAKKLTVDAGPSSPDGYTVTYEYASGSILDIFGSEGNVSGYAIGTDNVKKRLPGLGTDDGYSESYADGVTFLAWIK